MAFQTTIRADIGAGIVGDFAFEGPSAAQPGVLNSGSAANNVIGRAFTETGVEGVFAAGGSGAFAGILANHAVYSSAGTTAGGSLAPTTTLRNGEIGEFVKETIGLFVNLNTAFAVGNFVTYSTTTGELGAVATGVDVPAGYAILPGAFVERYTGTVAGLAVISIGTNPTAHTGAS
jgi:hypothetical protein